MDPLILKVYIWMYFQNVVAEKNLTVSDVSWTFSDNVRGTLTITDILITGWETLTNSMTNINVTEDENGNNDLCVYFPAEHLELTLKYDANIGSDNEIPIYGEGEILYRLENIAFNACMFINQDEGYVDDVEVIFVYRHTPLELTGFWRNREVSIILTRLLNNANRFIAMWNMYEPERTSCLWNPFITYLINRRFEYENASLDFDPTCVLDIFDEEDDKGIDIEEQLLRTILKSHPNDNSSGKIDRLADDRFFILPVIKHLTKVGMRLL